jgi:hypothetical protein
MQSHGSFLDSNEATPLRPKSPYRRHFPRSFRIRVLPLIGLAVLTLCCGIYFSIGNEQHLWKKNTLYLGNTTAWSMRTDIENNATANNATSNEVPIEEPATEPARPTESKGAVRRDEHKVASLNHAFIEQNAWFERETDWFKLPGLHLYRQADHLIAEAKAKIDAFAMNARDEPAMWANLTEAFTRIGKTNITDVEHLVRSVPVEVGRAYLTMARAVDTFQQNATVQPLSYNMTWECVEKSLLAASLTVTALLSLPICLQLVGFGEMGVAGESCAAAWQANIGNVEASSTFAILQSISMAGMSHMTFVVVPVSAAATAEALCASFYDAQTYI